eukprot:TRINITY_DN56749_c0_g1_i1.p1 TRINITY_DN56749_c0_g1~~TRINITY_DN56749_c0_g1_i1.p1  ORF type:complete len:566 (+),score=86.17 TRINITY_DN56749_c0_g1_i1:128-1699(+)
MDVSSDAASVRIPPRVDPAWYAVTLFRQRRHEEAIDVCTQILDKSPYDQTIWWVKMRALTLKSWIDDTELEDQGVGEILLDETALASCPRPGTSINRPASRLGTSSGMSPALRPVTQSGRPTTGFARPGTSSRPTTGALAARDVGTAFAGARPGTSRPVTSSGRFVRLGTASMRASGAGEFLDVERLEVRKYAHRPTVAKAICDYMIFVAGNVRKALELAAAASEASKFSDWWWKARLGKCYYRMGLVRLAEQQFRSAIGHSDGGHIETYLELGKVLLRLDQPLKALEVYQQAAERFPHDTHVRIAMARAHELVGDSALAVGVYRGVLRMDPSSTEALAVLAAQWFYEGHSELALRMYRRLLQLGCQSAELWNNLGLCCFYAGSYDIALGCFDRALALGSGDVVGDIWYNISHIAVGVGDLGLAYQCLKVAIHVCPTHAEAFNNLAILDLRKGAVDAARVSLGTSSKLGPHLHEPSYNAALLAFRTADWQTSIAEVRRALSVFPQHTESLELQQQLLNHFATA